MTKAAAVTVGKTQGGNGFGVRLTTVSAATARTKNASRSAETVLTFSFASALHVGKSRRRHLSASRDALTGQSMPSQVIVAPAETAFADLHGVETAGCASAINKAKVGFIACRRIHR